MALPLWGELEKAQDNPQTIDEAIAAAIAAHEADPEAHLGEGESLSEHKHQDVIDHPAQSILADKVTASEGLYRTAFDSLDGFVTSGDVSNPSWPGVLMFVNDGGPETSYLQMNLLSLLPVVMTDRDFLLQFDWYGFGTDETFNGVFGVANSSNEPAGAGFVIDEGELKGYAFYDGSLHYTDAIEGALDGEYHSLRVSRYVSDGPFRFFLDGVEVDTLTPIGTLIWNNQISLYLDANGDEGAEFRVFSVSIAVGLTSS